MRWERRYSKYLMSTFGLCRICLCLICLFCAWGVFFPGLSAQEQPESRDPRGALSPGNWSRYGALRIASDKRSYRLGEDITVRAHIENRGYELISLYLSNTSFILELKDLQGRTIPKRLDLYAQKRRSKGKPVFDQQGREIKEIILAPQESFVKTLYLNDFYALEAKKEYRLRLYLYPQIHSYNSFFVPSENILKIRIQDLGKRQGPHWAGGGQRTLALTPEETLYLFLSAEAQQRWGDYLKYLDLKQFINSYRSYAGRYREASPESRPGVLRQFAAYLCRPPREALKHFRITGSEPQRSSQGDVRHNGTYLVKAIAEREERSFVRRYEYTYTLQAQDNPAFWKITRVHAAVLP